MDSSDKSNIKSVEIYTYTDCKRKYSATTTTAWLQAIRETYATPIFTFYNKGKEQHPVPVKSDWKPQVQPSFALETWLEEVKGQLAEIELFKPRNNLPCEERKAIRDLRSNSDIVIKKTDKGSTTVIVIMNTKDKTQEGQVLLDDKTKYTPLLSSTIGFVRRRIRLAN